MPDVEPVHISVVYSESRWAAKAILYVIPRSDKPVVIPCERCSCKWELTQPGRESTSLPLTPQAVKPLGNGSPLITTSGSDLIIHGPGAAVLTCHSVKVPTPNWTGSAGKLHIIFRPILVRREIPITQSLEQQNRFTWNFMRPGPPPVR